LGKASSGSVQAVYGISGIANGATVKLTGTGGNQIYSGNSSNLYGVNGMVAGSTFNLNGNSETLTYLTGTGGIVDGGSGTPTLTIGDKSVNFAFGGVIQNSSGTLSLDKILGGTVTLSGANTYTGATTISSGTLILTGATQATSAISSSTTGKLGLDIGSPVTAANATVTFTNRTVLVTGSPTAASYTLLTASSIVGTPTFAAPAPAGYSLQVVDNNKLLLVKDFLSDPYEAWAGAGVNFDADANNDGVDNGLAWFLGAPDKDANANALLPKASQTAGALVLEFDCLDATARGAAVFQVQYGNDLTAWAGTNVPGTVGTFTAGVVDFDVTDPDAPGGLLKMVATIPVAQAGAGKLFGRINGVK
jgi:autotransporter-associated beta strand protein